MEKCCDKLKKVYIFLTKSSSKFKILEEFSKLTSNNERTTIFWKKNEKCSI